ncbi:MAG: SpaA isopeptide-forming pilin-related protein, partial [Eubacteriales bacterium]
ADPENVTISNAQVVDAIPAGQSFIDGSVTINGAAADTGNYTYDGGTATFTYTFPAEISAQQVITFKTKVADTEFTGSTQGSTLHENNAATLNHDGISVVSNTATVNVPVNFISKTGTYSSADKKINWTITINQVKVSIPDAVVTDTLPSGLILDNTSVQIDGVSSSAFSYSDPTITFTIGAVAEVHTITFSTNVDPNYYLGNNNKTYTNTATLTGQTIPANTTSSKGVGVTSSVVNKQGSSYDRATGQITWRVIVDSNVVEIDNAVITDAILAGQAFIPGSVTINGSAATEGSDYTFNSGTSTLTYTFPSTITTLQTVTFKTQVTDPAVYAGNVNTTYHNTATLTGSNIPSSQSQGSQNVYSQVIAKAGNGYDYLTRQISWKITVDANQMALDNAVVSDNIPIGQQYVAESESIDGGADSAGFSYTDAAGDPSKSGTLTYTFSGPISKTYTITFKTTVSDLSVFDTNGDKTFQNAATITDDLVPGGVTATGSQIVRNTVIGKSASYTAGNQFIDWSVTINTNSVSLLTSEITDQLQDGLAMDTSSIHLFHQTVDAGGNTTKGAEIALSAQNVQYDLATRTLHFTIPNPVAGSYLLTFRTDVTDKTKSPFTNMASFSGTGTTQTGTSQSIAVAWAGSGSSGTGEVGSMDVIKVDSQDNSKKLSGAVFDLIDKYGNIVQEQTTDSNGSALFSRLRFDVDYTIQEISPPTGYLLTGDPYTFKINGSDVNKDISYTYTDDQIFGSIRFTKTDGTNPLAGAVFTLYDAGNNAVTTATSGPNGIVQFQSVPYGSYTIKETTPPTGYFGSTAVLTASIVQNGLVVIPIQATVTNTPYLGNIRLTKVSSNSGLPLSGATFTLYRQSDTGFANPLGTAVSDASGIAEFENIPYGDYTIKETTPPTGYFASTEVITASITQDGQTVLSNPATVSDPPFIGNIQVTKLSSYDYKPLSNCTFSLYSSTDKTFSTPLTTAVSGANGIAEFVNIPYGNYTVRETNPPPGYFISNAVLNASVTKDGQIVSANPVSIADPPYLGNIQVIKTAVNGTRLSGAVFSLYKASDTAFATPIAMSTSGSDGTVLFQDIPYGSYTIKETTAPKGYQLNQTVLQAQITQHGQTVSAGTVSDTAIPVQSPDTRDDILTYLLILAICPAAIAIVLLTGKKQYHSRH